MADYNLSNTLAGNMNTAPYTQAQEDYLNNYSAEKQLGMSPDGIPYYALKRASDGGWDYFKGYYGKGEMKISEADALNELKGFQEDPNPDTSATKLGNAILNGQVYNLDDPAQKAQFFTDKLNLLTIERDKNIAAGRKSSDEQIRQLDQSILDTQAEAKKYVEDYNKNVNQFGEDYQLGNVKRQQYFAGLGANAFQSSQGDSALYANNKYIEGLGDMASEAQSNVGESFLRDQNGPLGENSIFGRTISEYNRQKGNVGNAFNDYLSQQNDWLNSQKDTLAGSFTAADAYKFAPTQVAAPTANKADLTPYTPFTSFTNPLGGTTPLNQTGGKFFTNNAFTKDTPLNTFLGKNKLDQRETDRLSSYLLGRA